MNKAPDDRQLDVIRGQLKGGAKTVRELLVALFGEAAVQDYDRVRAMNDAIFRQHRAGKISKSGRKYFFVEGL